MSPNLRDLLSPDKQRVYDALQERPRQWLAALLVERMDRNKAAKVLYSFPEELNTLLEGSIEMRIIYNDMLNAWLSSEADVKQIISNQMLFDPTQYIKEEKIPIYDRYGSATGEYLTYYTLDIFKIRDEGFGRVIKGISYDKQGRMTVQVYDAQKAAQIMASIYKMDAPYYQKEQNSLPFGFDFNALSQEQLARISSGRSSPKEVWAEVERDRYLDRHASSAGSASDPGSASAFN